MILTLTMAIAVRYNLVLSYVTRSLLMPLKAMDLKVIIMVLGRLLSLIPLLNSQISRLLDLNWIRTSRISPIILQVEA